MQCELIAEDLAAAADGTVLLGRSERLHVERCLRCQAELAQYRRMLRTLRSMRSQVVEPAPGMLGEILACLEAAGERTAIRGVLTGRRAAYLGGIAAAATAGAAAGAIVLASRRKLRSA
jgi:anti-sigma factor RsiW